MGIFHPQRLVVIFREKGSEHSLRSVKIAHLMQAFPKSLHVPEHTTKSRNEASLADPHGYMCFEIPPSLEVDKLVLF